MFYHPGMPIDTCNATDRYKGRLWICEKPLSHLDNHKHDDHEWTQERRPDPPHTGILYA